MSGHPPSVGQVVSVALALALLACLVPPAAISRGQDSERVVVTNTEGQGARLRELPFTTARIIRTVPEGERLEVVGADEATGGRTWRKVRDQGGNVGWLASEFVVGAEVATVPDQRPTDTASPPSAAAARYRPPASSPLCYDPYVRFRYDGNLEGMVRRGMTEAGMNPYSGNPFIRQMTNYAPTIVGGWMAVSLLRDRRGYPTPTLGQWIATGDTLSFGLSREEWHEMFSWEADSCETAFLAHEYNAAPVKLMYALVSPTRTTRIPIPLAESSPRETFECSDQAKAVLRGGRWDQDRQGYMYIAGKVVNTCSHSVRASVSVAVTGSTTAHWYGPVGIMLGPRQEYAFSDFRSAQVYPNVESARGEAHAVDCPENIC